MAVVGIHKALLQVTHPGALLGHNVLTLLHLCLQGMHVQGLLQLCSPGPVLIHLALQALVLILSLLYTSHSQSMSTLSTTQWTMYITISARECQPGYLHAQMLLPQSALPYGDNTGHTQVALLTHALKRQL